MIRIFDKCRHCGSVTTRPDNGEVPEDIDVIDGICKACLSAAQWTCPHCHAVRTEPGQCCGATMQGTVCTA